MDPVKDALFPAERLTDESAHQFFGYYDIPAFSGDAKRHLVNKVEFYDRLPKEDDKAELGVLDLTTHAYQKVSETRAWNFQQGAMLQWNPQAPDKEVIFNVRKGDAYRGAILNIETKERRLLDRPVANVDPTGKWALSVNFSRLFPFRPGYGYAGIPDAGEKTNAPEDDGVWLIDLSNGQSKLILSLAQVAQLAPEGSPLRTMKILVNHITFNTDGSRFVFLVRNFPTATMNWKTSVFTANRDGSEPFLLINHGVASHYHWRDPGQVLFWAGVKGKNGLFLLKDRTEEAELYDEAFFRADGHCNYSPDRAWLLYDSYPQKDSYRRLYVYDLKKKKGYTLGAYYSDPKISSDIRCDLHPRWALDGKAVTFDSIHEGRRHIYRMDLSKLI